MPINWKKIRTLIDMISTYMAPGVDPTLIKTETCDTHTYTKAVSPILTASSENLKFMSRILQIFSSVSEYRNAVKYTPRTVSRRRPEFWENERRNKIKCLCGRYFSRISKTYIIRNTYDVCCDDYSGEYFRRMTDSRSRWSWERYRPWKCNLPCALTK